MNLAVNGTLMRGLPLNRNLLDVGAIFVREDRTASCYRMWSIDDRYPAMQRDDAQGRSLSLELWSLEAEGLVELLRREPPGLTLGKILLSDGTSEFGILGESAICQNQKEITTLGGWREYCATLA